MTHANRMITLALIIALLIGWFGRFVWEVVPVIRPVESLIMMALLLVLLRWLVGRVD
jgi:hypothetical protein